MLEQELYIQTHTGSDGIAHIDISTGIADQDIEVTVSYSALENSREDAERERILANAKPAMDMSKFCGVIELNEDPLEYQRRVRDGVEPRYAEIRPHLIQAIDIYGFQNHTLSQTLYVR